MAVLGKTKLTGLTVMNLIGCGGGQGIETPDSPRLSTADGDSDMAPPGMKAPGIFPQLLKSTGRDRVANKGDRVCAVAHFPGG